ncbi:hypothetical protein [Saccharopolyspora griseoalba]|uniref:Uncharacterized protein n=1 Tax=Saccharopolyspora griseoalba TaxID=1431848 RepID=A0ABW2LSB1_9PSEU
MSEFLRQGLTDALTRGLNSLAGDLGVDPLHWEVRRVGVTTEIVGRPQAGMSPDEAARGMRQLAQRLGLVAIVNDDEEPDGYAGSWENLAVHLPAVDNRRVQQS